MAVQDGSDVGLTGADSSPSSDVPRAAEVVKEDRKSIVPLLHAFAKDFLKVT